MSIHKTKVGGYQVRWRELGKLKAKNFPRKIDAEKFEASLKLGNHPSQYPVTETRSLSLQEFIEIWLRDHAEVHKAPSSLVRDRQIIRDYIAPYLGGRNLCEIARRDLVHLQGRLHSQSKLAPKSINNVMGLVGKILKDATDWQYLSVNPASGLKPIKLPEQTFRFWTIEERDRFLSWAKANDRDLYRIVAVAVLTGLRRGEMEGLLRDCLDFERNQIVIRRSYCHKTKTLNEYTKGKRVRRVPMNALVSSLLRECSLIPTMNKVLPFDYQHLVDKRLRPAQKKAGVSRITFHDLRHTLASHLAMVGVSLFDIKEILGHSDVKTTMRYMHLAPGHLAGKTDMLMKGLETSSIDSSKEVNDEEKKLRVFTQSSLACAGRKNL